MVASPSPESARARHRLDGLEAGRGLAALFVLMAHAATIIAEPRFYGAMPWAGFTKFGAGVDFFFVLSGFIISWAHWGDIGRPDRWRNYALRRFRRIYPPYWVILIPLAAAYWLAPSAGKANQHDPWNLFFSFTLLPYPEQPILGVAWTLVYEMIFYALFSLVILRGGRWFGLFALWGAVIVMANLAMERMAFPFSILLDSLNLEFLCGMMAAAWLRQRETPVPLTLAVAGFGAFLTIMLLPYPVEANPLLMRIGYGVSAAVGVVGLAAHERAKGFPVPAPLRLMGAASYSIYLIHGVAISAGIQILTRLLPHSLPLALVMAALVVAGLCAGIACHLLVERPLARRMARGVPR